MGWLLVSVFFGILKPAKDWKENEDGEEIEQNSAVTVKTTGHEGWIDVERQQHQSHDAYPVLQNR
jgi:hypothetical protein